MARPDFGAASGGHVSVTMDSQSLAAFRAVNAIRRRAGQVSCEIGRRRESSGRGGGSPVARKTTSLRYVSTVTLPSIVEICFKGQAAPDPHKR